LLAKSVVENCWEACCSEVVFEVLCGEVLEEVGKIVVDRRRGRGLHGNVRRVFVEKGRVAQEKLERSGGAL